MNPRDDKKNNATPNDQPSSYIADDFDDDDIPEVDLPQDKGKSDSIL